MKIRALLYFITVDFCTLFQLKGCNVPSYVDCNSQKLQPHTTVVVNRGTSACYSEHGMMQAITEIPAVYSRELTFHSCNKCWNVSSNCV